jgi:hypothetical protein
LIGSRARARQERPETPAPTFGEAPVRKADDDDEQHADGPKKRRFSRLFGGGSSR